MSVTQMTPKQQGTEPLRCNRCNTALPREATFCGHCGERVHKQGDATSSPSNTTIEERYAISHAVRSIARGQNTQITQILQLSYAFDTRQQRQVLIRDIDISGLPEEERAKAIEVAQNEYDLLRQQKQPDITPAIDLHYYESHIYTIASWPQSQKRESRRDQRSTLQDLLQRGLGLPDEEVALTWAYRICKVLQQLHKNQIIVGNLDPQTLAMSSNDYDGRPHLMISWLPEEIRTLLQAREIQVNVSSKHFSAPEVFRNEADARSDIYSVGALLYLLLTGSVPAIAQSSPMSIRPPRELVGSISSEINAAVMQALCNNPTERFQSAEEFAELLLGLCSSTKTINPVQDLPLQSEQESGQQPHEETEAVTVKVTPLQMQQAQWYLSQLALESKTEEQEEEQQNSFTEEMQAEKERQQSENRELSNAPTTSYPVLPILSQESEEEEQGAAQFFNNFRQQISSKLPALRSKLPAIPSIPASLQTRFSSAAHLSLYPGKQQYKERTDNWLKRLQHFIFGEQHYNVAAAAIIEAPLRIQPNQAYTLRIHLMGRDALAAETEKGNSGISGLICGEKVHIEVRSALYQNFAYIVQQADVEIPHTGYAAEVTIPMQPLAEGPSGRRERLHILFSDTLRRPLYERPFVMEVYISHIVQSGQEGHNALTIPV